MAELPEREQASSSFDKLYTLAKKMEACQPSDMHRGKGSSDTYQDKCRRYPTPMDGWHKEHLNSKGVGLQQKEPTQKSPSQK